MGKRGLMEEEAGLHELIQGATEQEMEDLVRRRAEDLFEHARCCPVCDAKREEAVERVLRKLPPERRATLERAARAVVRNLFSE